MRPVLFLLPGGVLLGSVSAAGIKKRFLDGVLAGTTDSDNPGPADSIQWVQALRQPNATGHLSIQGFDISKPFDLNASIDGWTIDMNVTADVPVDKGFITGATIKLNPPAALTSQTSNGSLTVRADDSWLVCLTEVGFLMQSIVDAGKKDDGTCTQMLGTQCAADIRKGFGRGSRSGGKGCPSFSAPLSCTTSLKEYSAATIPLTLSGDKLLRSYEVSISSLAVHQSGNNTDYDRIGTTAVPILIDWQRNTTNSTGAESSPVTLACIRTNNTVSGSRVPGAASGRLDRMAGWTLVTSLFAVVCLVLF